uniref:Uncharacterized protein n=1 Tax=Cucumis sativus TaxID=3659 RepID=A0A0A0KQS1_CUCSA
MIKKDNFEGQDTAGKIVEGELIPIFLRALEIVLIMNLNQASGYSTPCNTKFSLVRSVISLKEQVNWKKTWTSVQGGNNGLRNA